MPSDIRAARAEILARYAHCSALTTRNTALEAEYAAASRKYLVRRVEDVLAYAVAWKEGLDAE